MQRTRERNDHPHRRQSRRRGQKTPELSQSTEIVLYNHAARSSPAKPSRRHLQQVSNNGPSKRPCGIKIRKGDVRSTYKVLPVVIGKGSFGTVRSCIHRQSKTKLAIKTMSTKSKEGRVPATAELLHNEIALLQKISHKNIVKVVDVIQDREYIHIIMEQCRGGDLFDRTVDDGPRLSERKIKKHIASLLDAVAYLHERNIVHRDLKAEHLMFCTDENSPVKIIDFGVATVHKPGDPPMTAFAGSVRSIAPEIVKRCYGKECDLWSCGVITYFLLMRQMPFDSPTSNPNEIFKKIESGRFGYPQWAEKGVSGEAKDFIDRLLVLDPRSRMTAKQALRHPWICGGSEIVAKQHSSGYRRRRN